MIRAVNIGKQVKKLATKWKKKDVKKRFRDNLKGKELKIN